ncbi:MAG: XkdX family protein [Oscillospiraceae bacterium]
MSLFEKIKEWYTQGLWNTVMVNNAVLKNKITQQQADEILGGTVNAKM